jgi:hypothetical protein
MAPVWAGAALAQAGDHESAPPADSNSPTGVSYGTGAFVYDLPLLSIGSGSFPQSLQLTYQYRSDGARAPNTAWTTNMAVRTSRSQTAPQLESGCPTFCEPSYTTWSWNIVVGHRSASFYKTGAGAGPGPYTPAQLDGSNLEWNGDGGGLGHFTFTSGDGAQIVFDSIGTNSTANSPPSSWIEPDGTTITYASNAIYTNRGVALFTETVSGTVKKICALNLTVYHLGSTASCPAGVPTVTITGAANTLSSITDASGGTTNFTYSSGSSNAHLTCIKEPGQSVCKIQNTYDICDGIGVENTQYYDLGSMMIDGEARRTDRAQHRVAQLGPIVELVAVSRLEQQPAEVDHLHKQAVAQLDRRVVNVSSIRQVLASRLLAPRRIRVNGQGR